MRINSFSSNNQSNPKAFKARNAEIRFADDVMRRVNNEFLKFSPTRVYSNLSDTNKMNAKQIDVMKSLSQLIYGLRTVRPDAQLDSSGYIKQLIWGVNKYKLGNCGESASLAKLGLEMNGIKSKKVSLWGYNWKNIPQELDHGFVIVNLAKNADLSDINTYGKKAYVVDLWSGFVDYVPNAFKRFEAEYIDYNRKFVVKKLGAQIIDFDIDNETLKLVDRLFPKLKINSNK